MKSRGAREISLKAMNRVVSVTHKQKVSESLYRLSGNSEKYTKEEREARRKSLQKYRTRKGKIELFNLYVDFYCNDFQNYEAKDDYINLESVLKKEINILS